MSVINCYCDSIFDSETNFAILGWKFERNQPYVEKLKNTTNNKAKLYSIIKLLEILDDKNHYNIFVNFKKIIKILDNKDKLIKNNFINKKGEKKVDFELYEKLFELNLSNINFHHVNIPMIPRKSLDKNVKNFISLEKFIKNTIKFYIKHKLY